MQDFETSKGDQPWNAGEGQTNTVFKYLFYLSFTKTIETIARNLQLAP
jgi:hypothetical protein